MAVVDVKITDLDPVDKLRDSQLFLIADPLYDSNGTPIPNNLYTSNSISGGSLYGAIKDRLVSSDLSVSGEWSISNLNIPTRYNYNTFKEIVLNEADREDMLNGRGKYESMEKNNLCGLDTVDSLSVKYGYVPNFDYVHRLVGFVFDTLFDEITARHKYISSYVGEIVFNTKSLSSQMLSIYGPETIWERGTLSSDKEVEGLAIDNSEVDIRLKNNYSTFGGEFDGDPNFYIDVPLNSSSPTLHLNNVLTAANVEGFKLNDSDIVKVKSFTINVKIASNTNHKGFYRMELLYNNSVIAEYPDGDGNYTYNEQIDGGHGDRNLLTSDPPSNNSHLKTWGTGTSKTKSKNTHYNRLPRGESAEGKDNFGNPNAGQEWEFATVYDSYKKTFSWNDYKDLSGLKLRIIGRNGWSNTGKGSTNADKDYARHPYRVRINAKLTKVTGIKHISDTNMLNFLSGSTYYVWKRIR